MRNDLSRLEVAVREANPVPEPSDLVDSDESVAVSLLVAQGRRTMTTTPTPQPRRTEPRPSPTRRSAWVFAAGLIVIVLVIGLVALLQPGSDSPVIDQATTSIATTPSTMTGTTVATSTSAVTPTVPVAPAVTPYLGEGWEILLSAYPDDGLAGPRPFGVSITEAGYYVESWPTDWYLMTLEGAEPNVVDVEVPGSGEVSRSGFVTGGPGVVAWATVGPESQTEAKLWVSSDGINFERVADDLLNGCEGSSDCRGTQIYAAAASPTGRVVALGYDPLVWNA